MQQTGLSFRLMPGWCRALACALVAGLLVPAATAAGEPLPAVAVQISGDAAGPEARSSATARKLAGRWVGRSSLRGVLTFRFGSQNGVFSVEMTDRTLWGAWWIVEKGGKPWLRLMHTRDEPAAQDCAARMPDEAGGCQAAPPPLDRPGDHPLLFEGQDRLNLFGIIFSRR